MMGGPEILFERGCNQLVYYSNGLGSGVPFYLITCDWEDEEAAEFGSLDSLRAFLTGALEAVS